MIEPYHQKPSLLIFRQTLWRPAWKCKPKKQTGVQGRLQRSPSTPNRYVSGNTGNTASPPSLWLVRVRVTMQCSSHGWSWYLYTRVGRGDPASLQYICVTVCILNKNIKFPSLRRYKDTYVQKVIRIVRICLDRIGHLRTLLFYNPGNPR